MRKYKILLLISVFTVWEAHALTTAKIAVIMKLNDPYSSYPQDIVKGMRYAAKKVSNIQIETFSHDSDLASIESAVTSAKRYNPDIVVAGETSQLAMIIARAFKDKVFITPTASSFMLNTVHPFPIRMIHSDDQYSAILTQLKSDSKLGKIGILHNVSYPNTNRISSKIKETLDIHKTPYVSVEVLDGEQIDEKKLSPFIKSNIDSLIIFSFDSDLRKVYSVLSRNKVFPLYIGGDGWGRDSFLKENLLQPGSTFKAIRAIYWNSNRSDQFFLKTKRDMELSLGNSIDAFHAIGFDTMQVIAKTLREIEKISDFPKKVLDLSFEQVLTSDRISFNSKLNCIKDMYLYRLDASGVSYYGKVIPHE